MIDLALFAVVATVGTTVGSGIYNAINGEPLTSVPFTEQSAPTNSEPPSTNHTTRSFSDSDNLNRRTPSHLDLLSRDDLGEALRLISRMLVDELD